MRVRIGTSGYSYQDWKGRFYPLGIKNEEMLGFYSRHFSTVELNTTYYGIPSPGAMHRMAGRVPPGFEFVVKANKEMTHADRFDPEPFARFREALHPLGEEGKLGGILAQFPWSFRRTPGNEQFLETLRRELPIAPVVVEFRNAEWAAEEVFELLRELGLGYCCVDEPRLKGLMPPVVTATSPVGYIRLHGRNARKWWRHAEPHERYDYLYSQEELREWVPNIETVAADTEQTYVFFNNHYEGKSALNAEQLALLLQEYAPVEERAREALRLAG